MGLQQVKAIRAPADAAIHECSLTGTGDERRYRRGVSLALYDPELISKDDAKPHFNRQGSVVEEIIPTRIFSG